MLVTYTFEERGRDFACQFSERGVSQEKGCFLHIFVILVLTKERVHTFYCSPQSCGGIFFSHKDGWW
jgi:hypothetical protein